MGCTETKEDIEYEMFLLRMERDKVRKEKNDLMLRYRMITGKIYKQKKIPDYILTEKKNISNKFISKNGSNIPMIQGMYNSSILETDVKEEENNIQNQKLTINN